MAIGQSQCTVSVGQSEQNMLVGRRGFVEEKRLREAGHRGPTIMFCPLTEAEVYKLLHSSHPTTCPLDLIPSHLLQAISPSLLPALTHFINTSLLTGTFSNAFKQARVTPLLKKTTLNTSLTDSYRPVSLLHS